MAPPRKPSVARRVQTVVVRPFRRRPRPQAPKRAPSKRGGSVESGLDTATRTVAGAQSMAIMAGDPVIAGLTAAKGGDDIMGGLSAFLTALKKQPVNVYFTGQVPRVAAEGGIGFRKLTKSALSGIAGLFRKSR